MTKTAKEMYEKDEARRKSCAIQSRCVLFCDAEGGYRQPLRTVSTLSAGRSLDAAVKKEGDGT